MAVKRFRANFRDVSGMETASGVARKKTIFECNKAVLAGLSFGDGGDLTDVNVEAEKMHDQSHHPFQVLHFVH